MRLPVLLNVALPVAAGALLALAQTPSRMPIPNDYQESTKTRWLDKPVSDSKLLDDAESLSAWKLIDVNQAHGEMNITKERFVSGSSSLRLRCATTGDKPEAGRYYGTTSARLVANGADWTAWNRLSFWVYPDMPGFRNVSMIVTFHNEGAEKVPDVYGKMGINYVILQDHQWNHVVWEIANLGRDKVTGVDFSYRMQGVEPGGPEFATFDIDKVELEKVQADHFEGWDVAPGLISFSHSGYPSGAQKSALASDLQAKTFELIDVKTGIPALTKNVSVVKSEIGTFQVMDFSEVQTPGVYIVRAGGRTTKPFPIGDDTWKSSLWKAINFFYVERCGFAIPGVHDICHRDWALKHGDKQLMVNGGWHDAGDLSQSLGNTAEAAYSMYSVAERMQQRNEDPVLRARLIEEANWGLDWLLKVTFHDGFRPSFSQMDRWTDGILGTVDDFTAQASNNPTSNLAAAATEAIAFRVLRNSDPVRAGYALKQAQEDWGFAVAGMDNPNPGRGGRGGRRGVGTELAGHAIIAALDLWRDTGDRKYADKAIELSKIITESQQKAFLPGFTKPLTGFFYTGTDKTEILRYQHPSHEEAAMVALTQLCDLFPDHQDWIKWYSAVTLYSEYFQKPMAQFSEPYGMLANSIYRDDEYLQVPESGGQRGAARESFRKQVLNGIKVGDHYYARLFPVWFEFRGNNGTMLAENKAISAAAHLRGSLSLASMAERNLEWVVGRNPFVESQMWGEGYDYPPQYTAMSGDIVGSLPVGIQSHGDADAPYWPTENCHNWKEVWVHPVGRWIWILNDLAGSPVVEAFAGQGNTQPVRFRNMLTSKIFSVTPDASGKLRTTVPEGDYEISLGTQQRKMSLLPGGNYSVDMTPGHNLNVELTQQTDASGVVTIQAALSGEGTHSLAIRADNLVVEKPEQTVTVQAGTPQKITWRGHLAAADAPWTVIVVPDKDLSKREELTGTGHNSR
ncbi:MAG: glycoside hydrolase family 9 protein [Ignavibacteriota bacterium]